jgi:CubicO group peptidase (beta-lactamase class C family)
MGDATLTTFARDTDPETIGLDPSRLGRLERHLEGYIASGRLVGTLTAIARGGRVGHLSAQGRLDAARPVRADAIWRIYSMTKPLTSVAALQLCEEGRLSLTEPVATYLPAFADARVLRATPGGHAVAEPAREPMRVWHLLTHTSGLTYGTTGDETLDAGYADVVQRPSGREQGTLAEFCDRLGAVPLVSEPGAAWNYSFSTDVLGRVVEVVSGTSLERVFQERIFGPLGMTDTGYSVAPTALERLAALYSADAGSGRAVPTPELDAPRDAPRTFHGGGAGLVSTARDYLRLLEMLRAGGSLDGVRLLSPATVRLMTQSHLPPGFDIPDYAGPTRLAQEFPGRGFGLGLAVLTDPVRARTISSVGEYSWGGAAATEFWVDPARDLTVAFFTQVLRSPYEHRLRRELRWLVYQALVD